MKKQLALVLGYVWRRILWVPDLSRPAEAYD
jgi:hypothetical protein